MKPTIKIALAVVTLSLLKPSPLACTERPAPGPPTAADLQRLQGSWEGVLEGHETEGKVSITITGHALRFQGLTPSQRFGADFRLPAGTHPQQLHATISDSPSPADIGKVVFAILKIENGTLTLAGIPASAVQSPSPVGQEPSFEDNSMFRYDLRRVGTPQRVPE